MVSLTEQIKLLGVGGVILSAALSGFGAINCTYLFFNFFKPQQVSVQGLKMVCLKNMEQITKSKIELLAIKNKGQNNSMINKIKGFIWTKQDDVKVQEDIQTLESLASQTFQDLEDILEQKKREKLSKSWKGSIYTVFAKFLTLYCIYKLLTSSFNVVTSRKYSLDPVTKTLQYLALIDQGYCLLLSNQIQFLFIGLVIATNIRSLAKTLYTISTFCLQPKTADIQVILASEIMALYFMATILMMRANLPEPSRRSITLALQGIDFQQFHYYFDIVFVIATLISALMIYLVHWASFRKDED